MKNRAPFKTCAALAALFFARETRAEELERRLFSSIDPTNGLTAAEVAERTVSSSPRLRAQRAETDAAEAQVDRATAAFLPSMQTKASYIRLSAVEAQPPFTSLEKQIAIETQLVIPISDYALRISAAYNAASKQQRAAELQERATRLQIASDAKLFFFEWARGRLRASITAQSLVQARQHLNDAENAFNAGTASRADVFRVEAQVAESEQAELEARSLVRVLSERLKTVMHDDGAAEYALGENLLVDAATAGDERALEDLASLIAEARAKRLEPQVLAVSTEAIEATSSALRAGYFPRLNGVAQTTVANPNQRYIPQEDKFHSTWAAGVEVSWSPSSIWSTSAQVEENDAQARRLVEERAQVEDAIRLEVIEAREAIANARSALATRARGYQAAEEAYRVRLELFRSGRATSVELTDSETELTRAALAAINAHIDFRVALVRFEHAMGRDVSTDLKS